MLPTRLPASVRHGYGAAAVPTGLGAPALLIAALVGLDAGGVPAGGSRPREGPVPRAASGRQRRSSKAFPTTLTDDIAMAPPASTGDSSPSAASGRPTVL